MDTEVSAKIPDSISIFALNLLPRPALLFFDESENCASCVSIEVCCGGPCAKSNRERRKRGTRGTQIGLISTAVTDLVAHRPLLAPSSRQSHVVDVSKTKENEYKRCTCVTRLILSCHLQCQLHLEMQEGCRGVVFSSLSFILNLSSYTRLHPGCGTCALGGLARRIQCMLNHSCGSLTDQ